MTRSAGAGQSSYGYTNEYQDGYNDLVYLRARHFAPSMGRFLSRDTWGWDVNRPRSLNRWMYTEDNPVNRTDPTGFYALALFYPGQEYGPVENATWTSDEMRLVEQALDAIAEAYAIAYNSYVLSHTPSIECLVDANGMPPEIAYILLNSGGMGVKRIDPVSAFWGIHNGPVTLYKHDHHHQKEIRDSNGNVIGHEDDNTYGMGPNYYSVYIYIPGEFSTQTFGKGNNSLARIITFGLSPMKWDMCLIMPSLKEGVTLLHRTIFLLVILKATMVIVVCIVHTKKDGNGELLMARKSILRICF